MEIDTLTVSLIVNPVTIVEVAVYMPKLPAAIRLIVFEFTLVTSIIRPNLHTETFTIDTSPLSIVDDSTLPR